MEALALHGGANRSSIPFPLSLPLSHAPRKRGTESAAVAASPPARFQPRLLRSVAHLALEPDAQLVADVHAEALTLLLDDALGLDAAQLLQLCGVHELVGCAVGARGGGAAVRGACGCENGRDEGQRSSRAIEEGRRCTHTPRPCASRTCRSCRSSPPCARPPSPSPTWRCRSTCREAACTC